MTIAMYSRTSWREVETGFAVGQMDGEFAGTIERRGDRFVATTGTGEQLGAFRSHAAAEQALERHVDEPQQHVHHPLIASALLSLGIVVAGGAALTALVQL